MKTSPYPFSRIISYILHPLLIPTFATIALTMRSDLYTIVLPVYLKLWFIVVVFTFTVAIPVSILLLLLKFNAIESIELKHRSERTIPLLLSSASFVAMLYSMKSGGMPPVFFYILYTATIAMLAGLLINMVYKISLHTLGWGAFAATLTSISLRMGISFLMLIIVSCIFAGLVGYARLKQNAHNPAQIYSGYVVGVCVILLISFLG